MTQPEEMLAELKKSTVFLIESKDEVVGSIMYEIKGPEHAYISGFVVAPAYQGKGIGSEAMRQVLKDQLSGFKIIDLVTHPENTRAIKLYISLGFVVGQRLDNYFGDGEPRIVMTRTAK